MMTGLEGLPRRMDPFFKSGSFGKCARASRFLKGGEGVNGTSSPSNEFSDATVLDQERWVRLSATIPPLGAPSPATPNKNTECPGGKGS